MTFRSLHDRMLVRRVYAAEKGGGCIVIPDTAGEKPPVGEIVTIVSRTRADDGTMTPLDIQARDKILFGKWSGSEVKVEGEDLIIMKESDVLGGIGWAAATPSHGRWSVTGTPKKASVPKVERSRSALECAPRNGSSS
jgi:chaperonin GroES